MIKHSLLDRIYNTKEGGILLSLIFGFAFTTLFRKVCKGSHCVVIKSDLEKIRKNIYKLDSGKCVSFGPKLQSCELKK